MSCRLWIAEKDVALEAPFCIRGHGQIFAPCDICIPRNLKVLPRLPYPQQRYCPVTAIEDWKRLAGGTESYRVGGFLRSAKL